MNDHKSTEQKLIEKLQSRNAKKKKTQKAQRDKKYYKSKIKASTQKIIQCPETNQIIITNEKNLRHKRLTLKQLEFLETYKKTMGVIPEACKIIDIPVYRFKNWLKNVHFLEKYKDVEYLVKEIITTSYYRKEVYKKIQDKDSGLLKEVIRLKPEIITFEKPTSNLEQNKVVNVQIITPSLTLAEQKELQKIQINENTILQIE